MSLLRATRSLGRIAIIDGGLATELEDVYGKNLSSRLWSASLLNDDPSSIKAVHRAFLDAGADIIITSSYQASLTGFLDEGFGYDKAKELMRASTTLALEARSEYMSSQPDAKKKRTPLVGISMGSYGAFRCDGSEGTGEYDDASNDTIYNYHKNKMEILDHESRRALGGVDLLIFETIPTLREAATIASLLSAEPKLFADVPAWISFRGKEDGLTGHGEPISDCIAAVIANPRVSGVGINCTKPQYVSDLLRPAKHTMDAMGLSDKTLFCYPNSGETWDDNKRGWVRTKGEEDVQLSDWALEWINLGATAVGGCCRTNAKHILRLAERIAGKEL
ncbi:Homocysteine S-methyltransferase [Cladochytrium replicatum]|nr:Homocysteine S-methyltransferase [Cladochytrium replicatum]